VLGPSVERATIRLVRKTHCAFAHITLKTRRPSDEGLASEPAWSQRSGTDAARTRRPSRPSSEHGDEIWDPFRRGVLHPAVTLTGRFRRDAAPADVSAVIREIDAARAQDAARRLRLQSVR